jgi:hypothetical protein
MDCAVELAEHFRPLLSHRLDVDTAIARLVHRPPYTRNTADVTECLRMIGELRTLVRQHEGVAEADRRHVAERDAALAQRDAAVARIFELQDQLEQFQRSHADAMAETSRILAAEREAATARTRELERYHADAMAEVDRRHVAERDMALAQRDAAVARIFQLQDQVEQFERSLADAMAETSRILAAEREAATARIRELERDLVRHADAMAEMSRIHAVEREAATARIMELERYHADAMAKLSRTATARIRRLVARLKGFIAEPPAQDGNIVRK